MKLRGERCKIMQVDLEIRAAEDGGVEQSE